MNCFGLCALGLIATLTSGCAISPRANQDKMYGRDVESITYQIGTANIDIVDAQKRQLIWESGVQR